jgi:hypothetical protein
MRIIPAAALALTLGMLTAADAASAASIIGSWSGRGTVRLTTGEVEPVSCKVRYENGGDVAGKTYVLNAKCAATAGTFDIYGRISQRSANVYGGSLFNAQQTVAGTVTISLHGNSQSVSVSSERGTGRVKLRRR